MFAKILFLYSAIKTGDVAHAEAVYASLSREVTPLIRYDIDVNCNAETLVSRFKEASKKIGAEKYVVFATGESGSQAIDILSHDQSVNMKNVYISLGIHQYFDVIKKLSLNYIAIPEAAVNTSEKSQVIGAIKKHTLTFAVPTNTPSLASTRQAYEEWEIDNKPELDKKYIIVMLPGDARDDIGMRYFTESSADKLFSDVKRLWEQNPTHTIIVKNGPRTGKYDPGTGEVACTHEYRWGEEDPSIAVDAVSRHFVALLQENQVPHYFFNFAVNKETRKNNSISSQILYIAQSNQDNFFIIPGESVFLLGQIPLYVTSFNAIVFKPSSMNSSHEAIFRSAFDKNFVSYFDEDGEVVHPHENLMRDIDDVHQVTSDLIEGYKAEMLREPHMSGW